jgi:NAD(P)-dependent dehydrogenase (short-subunit alcohol dehydrogenase family)
MDAYDSIKALVKKASELNYLDVVILNAALGPKDLKRSQYGWERALQVNSLSTALLGLMLLPILRRSRKDTMPKPRLEIVAARVHQSVTIEAELLPSKSASDADRMEEKSILEAWNYSDLGPEEEQKEWQGHRQYARSKLLVVVAMMKLADLAEGADGPDVVVDAVCPGGCKSELTREFENAAGKLIKMVA